MKYLEMREPANGSKEKPVGTRVARFIAEVDGATATHVRRVRSGGRPRLRKGETLLGFYVHEAPKSSWYNGETYLDTLDHASVKAFIKSTHEEYRRRFGKDFGGTIPGMFTDEPNHGGYFNEMQWTSRGKSVPWTAKLPAVFQRRYGYDVLAHLPELFLDVDGDGVTPARHNFHDCTTFLFTDAFGHQIGDWQAAMGINLRGQHLSWYTMLGPAKRDYPLPVALVGQLPRGGGLFRPRPRSHDARGRDP